MAKLN